MFAIHSECEVYNPKTDTWSALAPMQWRRSRSGVSGLRRLLYVVGGCVDPSKIFFLLISLNVCRYDGASDLATAESYNPLTNTWSSITPMGTKRSCLGNVASLLKNICRLYNIILFTGDRYIFAHSNS